MAVKALIRYLKHAQFLFRRFGEFNKIQFTRYGETQGHVQPATSTALQGGKHISFLGSQARRLFANGILNTVTNRLATDLRKRVIKRFLVGDSVPFFTLVGVSLASGSGILTKEDELEGVCYEIRDAVQKMLYNKSHTEKQNEEVAEQKNSLNLKHIVIGPPIAKGSSAIVHAARLKSSLEQENNEIAADRKTNLNEFPLALKMMFNYDAESNATAILKSMYKETIPARKCLQAEKQTYWKEQQFGISLPSHPFIVTIYNVFTDDIPALPSSQKMYPDALPPRLNPDGSGRNMSLFLLMKRYQMTLRQYLSSKNCDTRESVILLAQLLEGLYHINSHGIAHRDLKSDNLLIDWMVESKSCPSLAITDFGHCLADKYYGLCIPYNTDDVDKGGNPALMAPEIATCKPGPFTKLNYNKSDLWSVGSIAYEIFGSTNPFYTTKNQKSLQSRNYRETDLPQLPESTPPIITALIKNLLKRNITERLDADTAATVVQLYLWAPQIWLHSEYEIPSSNEIIQWILWLTSRILYEDRVSTYENQEKSFFGQKNVLECQLVGCFLSRVRISGIRDAFKWIRHNVKKTI